MKKLIVLLAVIAMVGAFTATAIADVSLYGSSRFRTFYTDDDPGNQPGSDSDKDLEWRMGLSSRFGANFKADKIIGKLEIDATAWGLVGALGWNINDMFTLEASYSSLSSSQNTQLDNEDDVSAFGLLAKFTVAPGVYIIPQFIYQDNKYVTTDGVNTDQGDSTIFGVFWRIDFK